MIAGPNPPPPSPSSEEAEIERAVAVGNNHNADPDSSTTWFLSTASDHPKNYHGVSTSRETWWRIELDAQAIFYTDDFIFCIIYFNVCS